MVEDRDDLTWAEEQIKECASGPFWGDLLFKYEDGRIITGKKIETLKPRKKGKEIEKEK